MKIDDAICQTDYLNEVDNYYLIISRCTKMVTMYGAYFVTAAASQKIFTIGSIYCPKELEYGVLGRDSTNSVFAISIHTNGDCYNSSRSTKSNFIIYGSYAI